MLTSARKLKASERMDACDIAAIPSCKPEYYEKLRGSFSAPFGNHEQQNTVRGESAHAKLMAKLGARAKEVGRG